MKIMMFLCCMALPEIIHGRLMAYGDSVRRPVTVKSISFQHSDSPQKMLSGSENSKEYGSTAPIKEESSHEKSSKKSNRQDTQRKKLKKIKQRSHDDKDTKGDPHLALKQQNPKPPKIENTVAPDILGYTPTPPHTDFVKGAPEENHPLKDQLDEQDHSEFLEQIDSEKEK